MGQARTPIMRPMKMLLALACLVGATAQAQSTAQAHPMAWLAGCWQQTGSEPGSNEQWMAPAGGLMLGTSRTLRAGQVREWEFMLVRDTPQGLEFVAWPRGQGMTVFAAETVEPRRIVFANPGHDFPQRVVYASPDADTLDAHIEGLRNGQLRTIRYPMKRMACPS
jgi:Domain of unknown function (DUF6265)